MQQVSCWNDKLDHHLKNSMMPVVVADKEKTVRRSIWNVPKAFKL